jgi:hypothetical protein
MTRYFSGWSKFALMACKVGKARAGLQAREHCLDKLTEVNIGIERDQSGQGCDGIEKEAITRLGGHGGF